MKYVAFSLLGMLHTPGAYALEQDRKSNVAALRAAKGFKTDAEVVGALENAAEPQSSADVRALHDAILLIDKKSTDEKRAQNFMQVRAALCQQLSLTTDARYQAVIKDLLVEEEKGMPSMLHPKPIRESFARAERLHALAAAAGEGKNRKALPILRKIAKRHTQPMFLDEALNAIGKIGEQGDLDAYLQTLKDNPKARLNLRGFGPALIDPVMRVLDAGNLTEQQKGALRTALSEGHSHEAIPQYVRLLNHRDVEIAGVAAQAIAKDATGADYDVLSSMLKNSKSQVRFPAVDAIAGKAWNVAFVDALIDLLQNDRDEGVRVVAMTALAEHHVQSAMPAIQAAANDSNRRIRGNAEYFLKKEIQK